MTTEWEWPLDASGAEVKDSGGALEATLLLCADRASRIEAEHSALLEQRDVLRGQVSHLEARAAQYMVEEIPPEEFELVDWSEMDPRDRFFLDSLQSVPEADLWPYVTDGRHFVPRELELACAEFPLASGRELRRLAQVRVLNILIKWLRDARENALYVHRRKITHADGTKGFHLTLLCRGSGYGRLIALLMNHFREYFDDQARLEELR